MKCKKENKTESEFCECENPVIVTDVSNSFGYQEYCEKCGKKIEFGWHYYNHYDGEDHIE